MTKSIVILAKSLDPTPLVMEQADRTVGIFEGFQLQRLENRLRKIEGCFETQNESSAIVKALEETNALNLATEKLKEIGDFLAELYDGRRIVDTSIPTKTEEEASATLPEEE